MNMTMNPLQVFDERTTKRTQVSMTFYSKYGEKQDVREATLKSTIKIESNAEHFS